MYNRGLALLFFLCLLGGCQYGKTERPVVRKYDSTIGVYARVVQGESVFSDLGAEDIKRFMVTRVAPGGPADRAGIQQGTLILKINGHTIRSAESLILMVRNLKPGTVANVKIFQDGKRKTVPVRVAESLDVWGWRQPGAFSSKAGSSEILNIREGGEDAVVNTEVPGIHID